ncbi:MLX-interacting protein [Tupaia chinensis]|uniref:MLX-interacting protein n=1 Tax=Tupaia chinensis TaxID=246437 RepID=L9KWI2_TUPCH|nr:MLX-interacting protein [Tupaia chinensis]
MVSSPHREHPPKKGYDFDTVNKQTCQTYSFGKTSSCHLSIDASLTKLFECMTLAYRVSGRTPLCDATAVLRLDLESPGPDLAEALLSSHGAYGVST